MFIRNGSITLKCLETKGCPWFSWPTGKTAYTKLQASRNFLSSSKSPPSFRGGSAANIQNKEIFIGKQWQNLGPLNWVLTQERSKQILHTCYIWKWTNGYRAPQANTKIVPIKLTKELQKTIQDLHMQQQKNSRWIDIEIQQIKNRIYSQSPQVVQQRDYWRHEICKEPGFPRHKLR